MACTTWRGWSPSARTNLRRLGEQATVRLMLHGHVAALAHTVLFLGWEPPERIPPLARFEAAGRTSAPA